ncbi:penicillin acylase family protein [Microbacterium sp. YY-01]|uniref:penicillin acylase family protein n=1 Tax=Microbacterium sp. YY-01 TaxID=3421634 RepID=UPI003D163256
MTSTASITTYSDGNARRRPGRVIVKVVLWVLAIVLVIAAAGSAFGAWTVQRSFPQLSGEAALAGLDSPVTVQRDGRGIPTITADNAHDLFRAQGYVHAQDRFWEMDFRRHVTSGRMAELFGESQVGTDAFLRTLGWRVVAEQEVEAMDDATRGMYEAYAEGVNAYLDEHRGADLSLEYAVLGIMNPEYDPEPWQPADSVAWLKAMAWDLRTNVEEETQRALLLSAYDSEEIDALFPPYPFGTNPVIVPRILPAPEPTDPEATAPDAADNSDDEAGGEGAGGGAPAESVIEWEQVASVVDAVSTLVSGAGEGIGSNSWVVSGQHTKTGMPLLANDPHLGAAMPSVWHQMQLRCGTVSDDCPFAVAGYSFSGLPGIVIGHNERIAWGFTNLTTDVADLYVERVDGDDYWRDGARVPLETRTDTIRVAGGEDVPLEIRSTVHGPIVSGLTADFTGIIDAIHDLEQDSGMQAAPDEQMPGEYAISLRWTALDPGTTASAIFAMNTAENFGDFRAAAAQFDVPAQNLIYADIDGNIGYQAPGRLPIRSGGDGTLPQPGWDSSFDWTGFIPFEDLPVSYNPPQGYIVTANNAIVDENYPYFLSRDWDYGYRAARITYLVERAIAAGPVTVADMQNIQNDNEMWLGKKLATVMPGVPVSHEGVRAAIALLGNWDAQNNADSAAAAYANVLWSRIADNVFAERENPTPLTDHGRLFTIVGPMLDNPDDPRWVNESLGVSSMHEMLALSAEQAYDELRELQGDKVERWNWGDLHALTLTHATLGTSGIAPIEWLFNRGPYATGGGTSVVNATGWVLGESYATATVPSFRMVIDLDDFDRSTWINLSGTSGHAFHDNYVDQAEDWAAGIQRPWAFTPDAVSPTITNTLTLTPKK